MRRPREHRRPSCPDTYCRRWVRTLQRIGLDYEIVVLENVRPWEDLADKERWWIAYGRASGWPLTNLTDGGGPSEVALAIRRERKVKAVETALARAELEFEHEKMVEFARREEKRARAAATRASSAVDAVLRRGGVKSLSSALALERKIAEETRRAADLERAAAVTKALRGPICAHGVDFPNPPNRIACICGHEETYEAHDRDSMVEAIHRLGDHISTMGKTLGT